jgi:hypothetical protein
LLTQVFSSNVAAMKVPLLTSSAHCKLKMAADRPDRDLRFILGHAFTLDKLRLRIAEIETETTQEKEAIDSSLGSRRERRVSFRGHTPRPSSIERPKSPPPDQSADLGDMDSDSDEEDEIEEGEDDGLSLRRFDSGAAREPQMVDDEGSSSEEDEPKSPPPMPSEGELRLITGGPEDSELEQAYQHVAKCPCHGKHENAPQAEHIWEIPQKAGEQGARYAVVAVEA